MSIEHLSPEEFKKLIANQPRKYKKTREKSPGEELLAQQLIALKIPFEKEFRFYAPHRNWRFDFLLTGTKFAIEVEGGVWSNGRHTRGSGFIADMEKYNSAAALGYLVLRFETSQVKKGKVIEFLRRIKSLNIP